MSPGLQTLNGIPQDLRARGRPGIGVVRRLLDERGPGFVATESELERRLLAALSGAGLPAPRRQVWTGGTCAAGRVDFAYPEAALVIEADSRRHHMIRLDSEADGSRDNWLMAAGWRFLRITWQQVTGSPGEVVRLVTEARRAAA